MFAEEDYVTLMIHIFHFPSCYFNNCSAPDIFSVCVCICHEASLLLNVCRPPTSTLCFLTDFHRDKWIYVHKGSTKEVTKPLV